jgi:hypothetical protein
MGDKPAETTYQLREVHMDPKAYRADDDPSIVYVVVPAGHFDAIRVNGRWKRNTSMTIGHLEDHFRLIDDPEEVARLFKAARTSTDRMFWARNVFDRVFRRQEAEKANPKPPSPRTSDNVLDPDDRSSDAMIATLRRRAAEREATDPKPPSREVYDYDEIENKMIIEMFRRREAEREARDKAKDK